MLFSVEFLSFQRTVKKMKKIFNIYHKYLIQFIIAISYSILFYNDCSYAYGNDDDINKRTSQYSCYGISSLTNLEAYISHAYIHVHRSIPNLLSHDFLLIKTMVHGKHLQHKSLS